jgi:hypothetical protein
VFKTQIGLAHKRTQRGVPGIDLNHCLLARLRTDDDPFASKAL